MKSQLSACLFSLCFILSLAAANYLTVKFDSSFEFESGLTRHLFKVKSWFQLESLLAHVNQRTDLVCVTLDTSQINQSLVCDVNFTTFERTLAILHLRRLISTFRHLIIRRDYCAPRQKLFKLLTHRFGYFWHVSIILGSELKLNLFDLFIQVTHLKLALALLLQYLILHKF